ncbi:MAG: glycosyl hydrolase, partial [Actinomycetota bacterium]
MSNQSDDASDKPPFEAAVAGLPMRSIGPAFMGGRIADIAIHPATPTTWYVAVGSGGVWKTVNAGITWKAVFEDQPSYSIGCVRIDPNHPEVIWVGTGEAVSGRHVAWGDGVYRSPDGGTSWKRMGLESAEHISEILIDPRNSDVVFVAAEGPLWSSGGDRGLFKTTDGGLNWEAVLTVDDDTGVTSAVFAPDDPDVLYAAAYQRRRRVWSFVSGGPGSGIHRSADGGETWEKITEGLPKSHMGRIGLAVTPAAPELVYATIEATEEKEQGFYRSTNRGHSWERRNEYLSGGTGPHYYQEIFASPVDHRKVYQVDVFINVTEDGGKTFRNLEETGDKHSDNHVVWIDPGNGLHLIVGTDAGLYETFDDGHSWRHVSNLPISQFYRVAVDNSVPFTNVLGGAQDLGTLFGPTRTRHIDGVRNQDWSVTLGADGYHTAFDPDEPDISYVEWQVGNVMRHDRRTMELTDIQPQPAPGEQPERWNWDTPIVISPHRSNRIYVGSQRVWRSEDRGDSWTAISGDLTRDQNRYELATTDRVVSVDALYDHMAMSLYGAITAFAESPISEDVLYVGTDDGVLSASDDGGGDWRTCPTPDDLPEVAFINDLEADRHDANGVFLVADDHKSGDYRPYLYQSLDRGGSWQSIRGDLPDGVIVWCIEQDHVNPDLLFIGAENGLYLTVDRGEHWHRLTKDVPTIAFRDLAVQRRDDDLVGATFGRGFYVLDDYSPLRTMTEDALAEPAALFPVRDAWWYVPYTPMQGPKQPTLGSTAFRTENPSFGATITYHLSADIRTAKATRIAAEKDQEAGTDVAFPG